VWMILRIVVTLTVVVEIALEPVNAMLILIRQAVRVKDSFVVALRVFHALRARRA